MIQADIIEMEIAIPLNIYIGNGGIGFVPIICDNSPAVCAFPFDKNAIDKCDKI